MKGSCDELGSCNHQRVRERRREEWTKEVKGILLDEGGGVVEEGRDFLTLVQLAALHTSSTVSLRLTEAGLIGSWKDSTALLGCLIGLVLASPLKGGVC